MTQPGLASELVQCTFVNGRTVFHSILSYNSHMSIPYYHVDAFTEELFAGNPAGVCILSVFSPEAPCRRSRLRINTRRPPLSRLGPMVISTCAGSRPKSKMTFADMRP